MLPVDRRHRILERVAERQSIHIGELADELGVSEMTVRRDIARLERDGFLRRTYGGATAHLTRALELAVNARSLQQTGAKRLIGMQAARLVEDAATLFVGIGSTAEQFVQFLPARRDLTVITGSLPIASLLGTRAARVVILGGSVRRDELSCIGPVAAATVRRYHADAAVVGAAAVSAAHGVADLNDDEAEIHRLMIERADRLVVIADATKLAATAPVLVAPAEAVDVLVTSEGAPDAELRRLRAAGVQVLVARRSQPGDGAPPGQPQPPLAAPSRARRPP